MKWLPFALLAVVGIVCQTTLVPLIRLDWIESGRIGPDWMFILAVYYALWGPWPDAAIAAWILGFVLNLFTLPTGSRVGLHAFCYGAAAWGIIRVRQVVIRSHPVAQFLIALVFALGIEIAVLLYRRWSMSGPGPYGAWSAAVLSAVYTGICAPPLLWVLARLGRLTGLRPEARPKQRGRT
jgi:rod shape-determining protein MreD